MLAAMFPALCVLHADATLLAVHKPAGLLAVPGRGEAGRVNLTAQVQATWPDALVVHRLDMATSGLLLFARSVALQRALSMAFAQRDVHKRYEALVDGSPRGDAGEIDLPLAADWPNRPRQRVDQVHGKPSLTRWQVVSRRAPDQVRVSFEPVTGRSHQLRVHAAAMGWPISGDPLYGPAEATAPRLMLHACSLSLNHPDSGQPLQWLSPSPF